MAPRSGQIIPRGDYKWLVRWCVGEVNGRPNYRSKMVQGTKRDAQKYLTSVLRSQDTGDYVSGDFSSFCSLGGNDGGGVVGFGGVCGLGTSPSER